MGFKTLQKVLIHDVDLPISVLLPLTVTIETASPGAEGCTAVQPNTFFFAFLSRFSGLAFLAFFFVGEDFDFQGQLSKVKLQLVITYYSYSDGNLSSKKG